MDQSRRCDKANGEAFLAGRQTETEGDMGLAGAAVAQRDDVVAALDVFTTASSKTSILLSEAMALKLKASRLLTAGNLACLIRRSTMRRSRSGRGSGHGYKP